MTATTPTPASLWRNSPYLLLMTGKTGQLIGSGAAVFAVPLVAYGITGSVLAAGVIGAVGQVGALLGTLPAGVIADRVDRRRLLIACSAVGAAIWLALWWADAAGALTGWLLAPALLAVSVVAAFYAPAEAAGIRYVVTSEQLGSAMAAMQGRGAVAELLASPLGGLLFGIARALPFLAGAVSYAVAGAAALLVRTPLNDPRPAGGGPGAVRSLREGFRFVAGVPVIRTGIGAFALLNLAFGGMITTVNLHLVATGTPAVLIALIDLASGASMLAGSLLAPALVRRFRSGPLAILSLAPSALTAAGLAIVSGYPAYLALTAAASLLVPVANSGLLGYVGAITPHGMQARMNSVLSLSWTLTAPPAPLMAGALLAASGAHLALAVVAAIMAAGVVALAANRAVRRIGRPETWEADLVAWPPAPAAALSPVPAPGAAGD